MLPDEVVAVSHIVPVITKSGAQNERRKEKTLYPPPSQTTRVKKYKGTACLLRAINMDKPSKVKPT